jgi:hypothetical protein
MMNQSDFLDTVYRSVRANVGDDALDAYRACGAAGQFMDYDLRDVYTSLIDDDDAIDDAIDCVIDDAIDIHSSKALVWYEGGYGA